jgi:hypothetical protein
MQAALRREDVEDTDLLGIFFIPMPLQDLEVEIEISIACLTTTTAFRRYDPPIGILV